MRGISKDRLLKLREHFNKDYSIVEAKVIQDLLNECQELNQWLPIDENTPKDRELLLLWLELGAMEGHWNGEVWYCDMWELTGCKINYQPTHYQELPDDPEPGDEDARNT